MVGRLVNYSLLPIWLLTSCTTPPWCGAPEVDQDVITDSVTTVTPQQTTLTLRIHYSQLAIRTEVLDAALSATFDSIDFVTVSQRQDELLDQRTLDDCYEAFPADGVSYEAGPINVYLKPTESSLLGFAALGRKLSRLSDPAYNRCYADQSQQTYLTIIHEIAHMLGLEHRFDDCYNVMSYCQPYFSYDVWYDQGADPEDLIIKLDPDQQILAACVATEYRQHNWLEDIGASTVH